MNSAKPAQARVRLKALKDLLEGLGHFSQASNQKLASARAPGLSRPLQASPGLQGSRAEVWPMGNAWGRKFGKTTASSSEAMDMAEPAGSSGLQRFGSSDGICDGWLTRGFSCFVPGRFTMSAGGHHSCNMCVGLQSQTKVLEAEGQYIGKRVQDLGSKEVKKGIGQPLDCFID